MDRFTACAIKIFRRCVYLPPYNSAFCVCMRFLRNIILVRYNKSATLVRCNTYQTTHTYSKKNTYRGYFLQWGFCYRPAFCHLADQLRVRAAPLLYDFSAVAVQLVNSFCACYLLSPAFLLPRPPLLMDLQNLLPDAAVSSYPHTLIHHTLQALRLASCAVRHSRRLHVRHNP